MPIRLASRTTLSRVMPERPAAARGGVTRVPFFTRKRFSPLPSATWPAELSPMPSA